MIPPDVVLSFSYIRGLLSIVRFYWFGSKCETGACLFCRAFWMIAAVLRVDIAATGNVGIFVFFDLIAYTFPQAGRRIGIITT